MIQKNLKLIPDTDPSDLIRLRDGIYATDLLITAIGHLDFFTEINKSQLNFDGVCNHFKIDKRCADVMLTYFIALGLISYEKGIYSVTKKSSEFLLNSSNWNLTPYFSTQLERPIIEKMLHAIKTGEPQSWGAKKISRLGQKLWKKKILQRCLLLVWIVEGHIMPLELQKILISVSTDQF